MTTEEAFGKLKRGDEKAFELIYKEYFPRLCLLSQKIVGDANIAEDIVQQLFFQLWSNRSKIDINTSGGGYLARSAYNLSLQHVRTNSIHSKHHGFIFDEQHASSENFEQQVEMASDDDRIFKLRNALKQLPEQCQIILTMSRFDNKKSAEIAEELNLSTRTVENQLYIGLKKLKELLNDSNKNGIIIAVILLITFFL